MAPTVVSGGSRSLYRNEAYLIETTLLQKESNVTSNERLADEIQHLREVMELKFEAQEEAVQLATNRLNERLEEMNKLREQISHERSTYLTRERFDQEHGTLIQRVSAIELQNSKWSGSIWMLGGVVSAIVVLINIALKIWMK